MQTSARITLLQSMHFLDSEGVVRCTPLGFRGRFQMYTPAIDDSVFDLTIRVATSQNTKRCFHFEGTLFIPSTHNFVQKNDLRTNLWHSDLCLTTYEIRYISRAP
jgi:hypothetical protein